MLRNPHSRLVAFVWIGWFVIGSLNVVASYAAVGSYWDLDVGYADLVYVVFTFCFFLGLLTVDIRTPTGPQSEEPKSQGFDLLFTTFLAAFPLLYAWSMHRALGSFPLLQGINLTQEMYELDYGPLYGYSIILVLAALVALHRARAARSRISRWVHYSFLTLVLFISVLDGKRFNLMLFIAGALAYELRVAGPRSGRLRRAWITGSVVAAAIVLYVGVLVLREGLNVDAYTGVTLQLAAVGVEHRDFVYTVNHFAPGEIPNYHWAQSALFSALNSRLLAAFGVDKLRHVLTGSAYAWRDLLGIDFGIRTGIISELYFAYGWLGLPVMIGVGAIIGFVARRLWTARTRRGLIYACAAYAILLLAPVGQTTSTTGGLTVVFYAFVLSAFTRRVIAALRPPPMQSAEWGTLAAQASSAVTS